jgi:ABC-type transport system, involved in lipoprotein release, permease component
MLFKLAYHNVQKNLRDFTIYFITILLGVCLFYVANAITNDLVLLQDTMELLSIFSAVILGFLIVYANHFLIKRRKKELGIYILLGMQKWKISQILILETFLIGIYAFFSGLLLGIFASQGLTAITALILDEKLTKFQLFFSNDAFFKSIICFGIIFAVTVIFNTISFTRYKLIDLLTAERKNEKVIIRNLRISVFLFFLSILAFGIAYFFVKSDSQLALASIFGLIGTFLFFFSLSGFLLKIIQRNHNLYFKGLNIFILRQFHSKITTAFLSMSIICLMLMVSISFFSVGAELTGTMSEHVKKCTPYDLTITNYVSSNKKGNNTSQNMINKLNHDGMNLEDLVQNYQLVHAYQLNVNTDLLMKYYIADTSSNENMDKIKKQPIQFIPLSDYNKSMILQKKSPITLTDNEYAICSNYSEAFWHLNNYIQNKDILKINGKDFSVYPKLLRYNCYNAYSCSIILPDKELISKPLTNCYLNMQLKGDAKKTSGIFTDRLNRIYDDKEKPFGIWTFKTEYYEKNAILTTAISYVTIYIGIIFLITCSAVLALQQLSESSDNIVRYKLLRKIGTGEHEINKSVFIHIFIYFMLPLSLAILESIIVIGVLNDTLKMKVNVNNINLRIATNTSYGIIVSVIGLVLLYGGYMLATYSGCKSMIRKKKGGPQ